MTLLEYDSMGIEMIAVAEPGVSIVAVMSKESIDEHIQRHPDVLGVPSIDNVSDDDRQAYIIQGIELIEKGMDSAVESCKPDKNGYRDWKNELYCVAHPSREAEMLLKEQFGEGVQYYKISTVHKK